MEVGKVSAFVVCLVAVWALGGVGAASHHAAAPAPAADCSTVVLSMADCLSFVTNGSTVSKPEGTCCSGLKTVLKTDPDCLCEAFKSSAQFGVVLNVTKATTLPAACHVSAPPVSNCGLSLGNGTAPVQPPEASSPKPSRAGLAPGAVAKLAPAPAPGASGSSALGISAGTLFVSVAVAALSII